MYKVRVNSKEYEIEGVSRERTIGKKPFNADIIEIGQSRFHILRDSRSYLAEIITFNKEEKMFTIKVNNKEYRLTVKDKYDELLREMGLDNLQSKKAGDIKAPMPGLVLNVMVSPGQKIKTGDAIVVLEAMKMENVLKAHSDGEVKKVLVMKGDKVEKNQIMVSLD